jgi:hypothetical protein
MTHPGRTSQKTVLHAGGSGRIVRTLTGALSPGDWGVLIFVSQLSRRVCVTPDQCKTPLPTSGRQGR